MNGQPAANEKPALIYFCLKSLLSAKSATIFIATLMSALSNVIIIYQMKALSKIFSEAEMMKP